MTAATCTSHQPEEQAADVDESSLGLAHSGDESLGFYSCNHLRETVEGSAQMMVEVASTVTEEIKELYFNSGEVIYTILLLIIHIAHTHPLGNYTLANELPSNSK